MVAQRVVLLGIPPGMPGFQVVRRASGMMLPGVPALTVATPVLVRSATLVAMTVSVPATAGARYTPFASMVPPPGETNQVTAVDCPAVVPVTVAWKVIVPPRATEARDGVTATAMTGAGAATVKLTFDESCHAPAAS